MNPAAFIPGGVVLMSPVDTATTDNYIYIGALGGGRRDKGFAVLPVIIRKFNQKYKNFEDRNE